MSKQRRVGFCLSEKKRRKMNLLSFAELCATHGLEVIEIDLTHPLASQGPFDVIIHKLSDVIVEAEYNSQSQQLLTNFQSYVSAHPSVVLLDPFPAMMQLLDRFASYRIMSELHHALRDWCVCSPSYLEVRSSSQMSDLQQTVQRKGLSFPLVCKTRVAHGSRSHEVRPELVLMCLIFCPSGLRDVRPPCILQSFVNHGAVLHKVFVVGDAHFTVERPSLKNFPSGPCERETIFFNSHEVSKPESCSDLTALDEKMPLLPPPSAQAVGALVAELRAQLGMALFGVDVILNIHTHTLTVIDINIFPGYEGVPQFFSLLLSHIESVLDSREDPQAAGLPASQAAGLPASQAAGLPASQAAGLPASQAAGLPASQAAGLPASQGAGPPDPQREPLDLGHCDPQDPANPPPPTLHVLHLLPVLRRHSDLS